MTQVNVGDQAPDFTLRTADRGSFHLAEAVERGPVIVAFFPFAFTSTCTSEMCTFTDHLDKLKTGNVEVVGVSMDAPDSLKAWAKQEGIQVPLASDWDRTVTKAYGVEGTARSGLLCPRRSIFVVGKGGTVRYRWIGEHNGLEPPYAEVEEAARNA